MFVTRNFTGQKKGLEAKDRPKRIGGLTFVLKITNLQTVSKTSRTMDRSLTEYKFLLKYGCVDEWTQF